mmetsp:Transcript_7031/g.15133  ORF Transcript_7031/g.15133 Transcript_7031/m.15133 type:complete len:285 (-) Transcript_7031:217-1071(-)
MTLQPHPVHQNQIPLLQLLRQRMPHPQLPHLLIQLGRIILHLPLGPMGLGPPPPMGRTGVPRPGPPAPLLLSHFPRGAADGGDGFGDGPGVAFPASFVPLVDDAAVEEVDADGVEAEGVGGEVEGAEVGGGAGVEGVDGDVEALGEGDGVLLAGGRREVVQEAVGFAVIVVVVVEVEVAFVVFERLRGNGRSGSFRSLFSALALPLLLTLRRNGLQSIKRRRFGFRMKFQIGWQFHDVASRSSRCFGRHGTEAVMAMVATYPRAAGGEGRGCRWGHHGSCRGRR